MHPHQNNVFFPHKAKTFSVSFNNNFINKFINYGIKIKQEELSCFLTIEFINGYLNALLNRFDLPIIIWLQDPRTMDDWYKIRTIPFDFDHLSHTKNAQINKPWKTLPYT